MKPKADDDFLFLRSENNQQDEWDDTFLIKAYDRAMAKARKGIMKKIQAETGATNEELKEVFSDASSTKNKKKKKNNKKKKNGNWAVGDACRAVYSEDGEEYEAEIVAMINPHWCTVKFIGYNNQEEVRLNELTPSLGRAEIELQIETAKWAEQDVENGEIESGEEYDSPDQNCNPRVKYEVPPPKEQEVPFSGHNSTYRFPPRREPFFFGQVPPPPPPPPPAMGRASANLQFKMPPMPPPTSNDQLNTLLLSWYMCGYYTGLHQRDLQGRGPQYPNSWWR